MFVRAVIANAKFLNVECAVFECETESVVGLIFTVAENFAQSDIEMPHFIIYDYMRV